MQQTKEGPIDLITLNQSWMNLLRSPLEALPALWFPVAFWHCINKRPYVINWLWMLGLFTMLLPAWLKNARLWWNSYFLSKYLDRPR